MSKLNIEGKLIGTTADKVDYANSGMSGVADAKAALDNLQTRLSNVEQGGGGEIDNERLAYLASTLVETSGIASESFLQNMYYNPNHAAPKVGDTFVEESSGVGSGVKLIIHEGEVLHYKGIGLYRVTNDNVYGYIFVDKNNVVIERGAHATSESQSLDGSVVAPAGSEYVYVSGSRSNFARAWVAYTNRPHVKKGLLQCYGDSIMSYNYNTRFYTYPLILAARLGVTLSRHSLGGAQLGSLANWIPQSRCDADVYLNAMGYNSIDKVTPYDEGGKEKVGTAEAALAILPADGLFSDLTSEQVTALNSTSIGLYWYYTNMLINFAIKPNAQFLCVGLFGLANDSTTNTVHKDFRAELKNLVNGVKEAHPNVHYIDGQKFVLAYSSYFFEDSIHPNQLGQIMIANGLYPYLADLFGKMDVYYDNNTHPEW